MMFIGVNFCLRLSWSVRGVGNTFCQESDWLKELVRQVTNRCPPDPRPPAEDSRCLFQLGVELMEQGENMEAGRAVDRAIGYRDGLIIALLACRPLRRRTLAAIRIGRHLVRAGDRWWPVFSEEDVKNRRPLELPWPEALAPALRRYLDDYRIGFPKARESDALWLSCRDGALTPDGIYQRVCHWTKAVLGRSVSPHQFRHAAATTISRYDPEHVMAVSAVLGHANLDMAYRHYISSQGREACEAYQSVVSALRKDANGRSRQLQRR